MRKFRKSLAVILAISLCASFCTTSVYADEIHPNLNDKEVYEEEISSEAVVSEETCEEEISEEISDSEVKSEIIDSEEKSEIIDSEEKSEITDSEEPASEDDPAPEETVIPDESVILDETEELNAAGDVSINPTNFPDENFRNFISSEYDQDGDGIIRSAEISNIKEMFCSNKGIKNLKGIDYFTALTRLECYTNQLTSLDVSGCTALEFLWCDTNQLTSLDVSKNTALTTLWCHSNQLTSLDVSKNTALYQLSCSSNQLTSLDVSKNTALKSFSCESNQLTSLDVSKNTALHHLSCSSNQLTSLDVSKNTALKSLYCHKNQLTSLDVSKNTALEYLVCYSNQLTSLDVSNCPKILEIIKTKEKVIKDGRVCYYVNKDYPNLQWDESVNIITGDSSVVDVSINPTNFPDENFRNFISSQYDQDGDGIIRSTEISNITGMNCSDKGIKDLKGIEYFTALEDLSCRENQLTSLDVSKNTALTKLYCGSNQLTSLDVSKNTALKQLWCFENQLTSLDVSKNTALEELSCKFNKLTNLDVTGCTALTYVECYVNQLTSLDVSNNTALIYLYCWSNRLTSLDVSKNAALKLLHCNNNQLTSLDVSKNTALSSLYCGSNQLTSLDVSNNTALRDIGCGSNQLTSLDVSKNPSLINLSCFSNQLTSLDVSKNPDLESLVCNANKLTRIDVKNCPKILEIMKTKEKVIEDGCVCYYMFSFPYLKWDESVKVITPDSTVVDIFDDVKAGAWYVSAVQYAYDNNIMAGTNGGKSFSPDGKLTREQFTQVLYNWEGKPPVSISNPFSDVKEGSWYINSVLWAKEKGISNGKPDGTFGVGGNITRQDLARMLYIYAQNKGYDLTKKDDAIDGFSDKDRVAPYAKDAMNWAVSQGIIGGKGGGRLDPVGNATRAECAQMMKKLLQNNLK